MPTAPSVTRTLLTLAAAIMLAAAPAAAAPAARQKGAVAETKVDRGRYLVKISGCNDCHTAGCANAGGKVPEAAWLTGDALGWRGAWGTTYPANLRLHASKLTEKEWIKTMRRLQTRPPMPWFGVREMRGPDLAAVYQYIKQLGAVGEPAPSFVPPGTEPKTPFVQFPLPAKP